MASNTDTPCVFAATWISNPSLHWDGRQKESLAHYPTNTGILPSVASSELGFIPFPIHTWFKALLMSPVIPVQRSFCPFETGVPYVQRSSFLRTQKLIPVRPVASGIWQVAAARCLGREHPLRWAYVLSPEAAKADGSAALCKEGSSASSHLFLNWSLHALMKRHWERER